MITDRMTYVIKAATNFETNHDIEPDFAAYVDAISECNLELLAMEVKTSTKSKNKLESDQVRLGKQMKIMIDKLVYYEIEEPVVFGILVKGRYSRAVLSKYVYKHIYSGMQVKVFTMILPEDGHYVFLELGAFDLFEVLETSFYCRLQ